MNLKVKLSVNISDKTVVFKSFLNDLDLNIQEWNKLSQIEKFNLIQEKLVFTMLDQPYWLLDSFEELEV